MVDYMLAKPIQKTGPCLSCISIDAGRKKIEDALHTISKYHQRLMQVFNSGEQAELTELFEEIQTYRLSLTAQDHSDPKSSILEFSMRILFIY